MIVMIIIKKASRLANRLEKYNLDLIRRSRSGANKVYTLKLFRNVIASRNICASFDKPFRYTGMTPY